jgi:hypothetical protein
MLLAAEIEQRGSSVHHQEHKTVHTSSGTVKPILLPAAIVNEMELGGFFAHHQEHKTVHTASGIVKLILLLSRIRRKCVPSHPRQQHAAVLV